MTTVIKAENLGKKYIIRHKQDPYDKFADVLVKPFKYTGQKLAQPFTKKSVRFASAKEEFWALKDVSFEIKQGDRVGIIGRNGAGKSTLLKLINRITEPTTGKISIRGRVSSLLEVGTGFHPELTGRENIYLNGAVLGMTRKEIKRKFDEIVAFAEVEKFLDTPVKRYSSGMYVRLAFAVAAHLEPEILIVDEVLAVGDTAFQKKCLGKMQEVGQEGRTVLFVSHNMEAIMRLCNTAILLSNGSILRKGNVHEIIGKYLDQGSTISTRWEAVDKGNKLYLQGIVYPKIMMLVDKYDNNIDYTISRDKGDVYLLLNFELAKVERDLCFGYSIFDDKGNVLYRSLHTDEVDNPIVLTYGANVLKSKIPLEILNESSFQIVFDASVHKKQWIYNPFVNNDVLIGFEIKGGLSRSGCWQNKRSGLIAPVIRWEKLFNV